jgi:hypothetical protein
MPSGILRPIVNGRAGHESGREHAADISRSPEDVSIMPVPVKTDLSAPV